MYRYSVIAPSWVAPLFDSPEEPSGTINYKWVNDAHWGEQTVVFNLEASSGIDEVEDIVRLLSLVNAPFFLTCNLSPFDSLDIDLPFIPPTKYCINDMGIGHYYSDSLRYPFNDFSEDQHKAWEALKEFRPEASMKPFMLSPQTDFQAALVSYMAGDDSPLLALAGKDESILFRPLAGGAAIPLTMKPSLFNSMVDGIDANSDAVINAYAQADWNLSKQFNYRFSRRNIGGLPIVIGSVARASNPEIWERFELDKYIHTDIVWHTISRLQEHAGDLESIDKLLPAMSESFKNDAIDVFLHEFHPRLGRDGYKTLFTLLDKTNKGEFLTENKTKALTEVMPKLLKSTLSKEVPEHRERMEKVSAIVNARRLDYKASSIKAEPYKDLAATRMLGL